MHQLFDTKALHDTTKAPLPHIIYNMYDFEYDGCIPAPPLSMEAVSSIFAMKSYVILCVMKCTLCKTALIMC